MTRRKPSRRTHTSMPVALFVGMLSIFVLTAPGQVANGRKEATGIVSLWR